MSQRAEQRTDERDEGGIVRQDLSKQQVKLGYCKTAYESDGQQVMTKNAISPQITSTPVNGNTGFKTD